MFLAFLAYAPLWTNECAYAQESWSYGLRWGGYSTSARTLLFTATQSGSEGPTQRFLGTYDEEKKSLKYLSPTSRIPLDFAWIPGKTAFVVTHRDGMTLFQADASSDGYGGTAIECPTDFIYNHCAWSPTGRWLAVNCYNLERASKPVLGLYSPAEKKFMMSGIPSDNRIPIWRDDATVYVTSNGDVGEVRLEAKAPRMARTILSEEDLTLFYGLFEGRALVLMDKKVLLGETTLAELDQADSRRVIAAETTIFVSPSPTHVVAFDRKGRELGKAETEGTILFGSIGRESNAVFGLRGSLLLCVRAEGSHLEIKDVCDLGKKSVGASGVSPR